MILSSIGGKHMKLKYETVLNKIMNTTYRQFDKDSWDFVRVTCLYLLNKGSKVSVNKTIDAIDRLMKKVDKENNKTALNYIRDELSKINSDIFSKEDRERAVMHRELKQKYESEIIHIAKENTTLQEYDNDYMKLVTKFILKELRRLSDTSFIYKTLDSLANGTKKKSDKDVIRHIYIRLKKVQFEYETNKIQTK